MKKELLASTALVGAALLMAGPATAQTKVKLSGNVEFQAGFVDQDQEGLSNESVNDRGYGFASNNELAVKASGKTDAGMKWSAKVELETDTNATGNTDEAQVTFSGSWGALVLGNEDGPADLMMYDGANAVGGAGTSGFDGDWHKWSDEDSVNSRLISESEIKDSSDGAKIAYYTPRINGLQLGIGFSPDRGNEGSNVTADDNGDEEDFFEFGINYVQKFDALNVALSVTHSRADNEDDADEDTRSWSAGFTLGWGPFKIGAGYMDDGDGARPKSDSNDDSTAFDVGVGWKQGPVKVALSWLHAEVGVAGSSGEDEHDVVALGATYTLGKGVTVYAEGFWYDSESEGGSVSDNEAIGLIIGTNVKF